MTRLRLGFFGKHFLFHMLLLAAVIFLVSATGLHGVSSVVTDHLGRQAMSHARILRAAAAFPKDPFHRVRLDEALQALEADPDFAGAAISTPDGLVRRRLGEADLRLLDAAGRRESLHVAESRLLAFTPWRDASGQVAGGVIVGLDLNRVHATRLELVAQSATVGGVLALALTVLAYYFARSLTGPLERIIEGTARASRGDLTNRVKLRVGDEFDILAGSFNQMLENIQKTRVSKNYVDNILRSMRDALIVVSTSGKIISVNRSLCQMLDYRPTELAGQSLRQFLAQDIEPQGTTQQFQAVQSQLNHFEIELIARDGRKIPAAFSVAALRGESDEAEGFVWVGHDNTEQRRTEAALQKAKEAAEAAAQAKAEFLADMSHEIRTPLNAIVGMTRLLLGTRLQAEQKDYATTIQTSSETLLDLVDDLLNYSKIEAGKFELHRHPFSVRHAVEEAVEILSGKAAEKNLEMGCVFDPKMPGTVNADAAGIRQILLNLLSNAVKFTVRGEVSVRVSAERRSDGAWWLTLAVSDTGIGIPEDRMDRLFKSFSQVDASTRRRFGGTGLGLAICRRLCELMGGSISIKSEVGQGSTFYAKIAVEATGDAPHPLLERVPEFEGKRILVVSRSAINREILETQCRVWGVEAAPSGSAPEAAEKLARLVIDDRIPPQDGRSAFSWLAARFPKLPKIALVFRGHKTERLHADVCLTKPIKSSQLYGTLSRAFEGHFDDSLEGPARELAVAKIDAHMADRHPLKILIAEDNAINQKVATRLLEQLGYTAEVAHNGLQALERLERQSFDLVFMDVRMPDMDGLEATRRIRQRLPRDRQPRIVAVTANALSDDREKCLAAGMDAYMSKPVKFDDLLSEIEATQPLLHRVKRSVFDSQILRGFAASVGGDDVFQDLVQTFREDGPGMIQTIESSLETGSLEEAARAAHSLKSNAQMFGATGLADLCREVEEIASREPLGDGARIRAAVPEIRRAFDEVLARLTS